MLPNPTDFFSQEDYEAALDEALSPLASPSDARREYAKNAGRERPDREWILTVWDTWEANPFYQGPKGPHPEDDSFWQMDADEQAAYIAALNAPRPPRPAPPVETDDDIPF